MTSQLPPDDQPESDWKQAALPEEAEAALPSEDLTNPVSVAFMFFKAIQDPLFYQNALHNLTTPESHDSWDGFTEAAAHFAAIKDPGIGTMVVPAVGDESVVYAKIMGEVDESYQVLKEQIVGAAAILTLVWRPEHGMWMVHAMGEYVRPEDVPHGDE